MQNDRLNSGLKFNRVLVIYSKLMNGEIVNKYEEAEYFGVDPRSIQRDINDLRCFFADNADLDESCNELVYDRQLNGYHLVGSDMTALTNSEALAVCKILLGSRAFTKNEMTPIINKLLTCCVKPKNKRMVNDLISNEPYHYTELNHHKRFVNNMWEIGDAVQQHLCMKIIYTRQDGTDVKRIVQPIGIMFSAFYFYLAAFNESIDREKELRGTDDSFPTIYRIDRIQSFEVLNKHFNIQYESSSEENELHESTQFMCGVNPKRIKFLYKGKDPEPILDRFPTAKIIKKTDEGYVISAEVFGDGADMWVRSQEDMVTMF